MVTRLCTPHASSDPPRQSYEPKEEGQPSPTNSWVSQLVLVHMSTVRVPPARDV